jgi:hypothetical protein
VSSEVARLSGREWSDRWPQFLKARPPRAAAVPDRLASFSPDRAEAERLRQQVAEANRDREEQEQRREALVESVAAAVPAALAHARAQAWDAGWEAARHGLPKSANPVRSGT